MTIPTSTTLNYTDQFDIPTSLRDYAEESAWGADGVTPTGWRVSVVPLTAVNELLQNQQVVTDALIAALRAKG